MGKRTDGTCSKGNPIINFRVTETMKQRLKDKCKGLGVDMSERLRHLIEKDLQEPET